MEMNKKQEKIIKKWEIYIKKLKKAIREYEGMNGLGYARLVSEYISQLDIAENALKDIKLIIKEINKQH